MHVYVYILASSSASIPIAVSVIVVVVVLIIIAIIIAVLVYRHKRKDRLPLRESIFLFLLFQRCLTRGITGCSGLAITCREQTNLGNDSDPVPISIDQNWFQSNERSVTDLVVMCPIICFINCCHTTQPQLAQNSDLTVPRAFV